MGKANMAGAAAPAVQTLVGPCLALLLDLILLGISAAQQADSQEMLGLCWSSCANSGGSLHRLASP